jgi:hypothetical protein
MRFPSRSFTAAFGILSAINALQAGDTLSFSAISVSIADDGSGKLSVDTRPADEAHQVDPLAGKTSKAKAFGEAEVISAADGRTTLRYDFAKIQDKATIKSPVFNSPDDEKLFEGLAIDTDEKALVLMPRAAGSKGGSKRTRFQLPRWADGPTDVTVFFSGASEGLLQLQLFCGADVLVFSFYGANASDETSGTITLGQREGGGSEFKTLLKVQQPVGQRKEYEFKVKPEMIDQRMTLAIGLLGDLPVAIPFIELTSTFRPAFGMALNTKGNRVVVGRVIAGSASAEAGIKEGDVILSINGEHPKTHQEALKNLGACSFDKDTEIEVERFGKKRQIKITPQ